VSPTIAKLSVETVPPPGPTVPAPASCPPLDPESAPASPPPAPVQAQAEVASLTHWESHVVSQQ